MQSIRKHYCVTNRGLRVHTKTLKGMILAFTGNFSIVLFLSMHENRIEDGK